MDSGNKEQIESAMAEMAVAQLSGRIPALFDHYVGFEISEIEEDGARAFGLLGFAIRDIEAYVPVIYLGGRIKGTETMNLAASGKFVSATRSWADYLIELGRSTTLGTPGNPPNGTTGSSAALDVYRSPDYAFSGYKAASIDRFLGADLSQKNTGLDVPRVLKLAGREAFERFSELVASDDRISEALFRHYGDKALDITFDSVPRYRKSAADLVGTSAPEAEVPEVKIVEKIDDPAAADLTKDQKIDLATTGIAVVDARDSEAKSRVIKVTQGVRTTNPNSTGIYQVLSSGTLEPVDAILAPTPFAIERPSDPMPGTLILGVGDSTDWFWDYNAAPINLDMRRVVVVADTADNASEKLSEKIKKSGVDVSSAKVGSTYVLVRKDGARMSMPFKIGNKAGGRILAVSTDLDCYRESLRSDRSRLHRGYTHPSHSRMHRGTDWKNTNSAPGNVDGGVWIETVDANGVAIVETGMRLIVPTTWSLMEVTPRPDGFDDSGSGDSRVRAGIASASEIEAATLSATPGRKSAGLPGYERLMVETDSAGCVRVMWRGKLASMRRPAAAIHTLVGVVGLSESDARSLVGKAVSESAKFDGWVEPRGYHKTAAAINIPWPDDLPRDFGSTEYSGTKIVMPTQIAVRGEVEGYHDRRKDYDPALANYTLVAESAGKTIGGGGVDGIVSRAAQSGIKQVFDMAVASFLMRGGRLGIEIEEDILPYLEAGLDRACRLILRFYWNNREFADLYGSDGMAEFEDIILSNIKETGKAVLFLKRRSGSTSTYDDLNSLSEE